MPLSTCRCRRSGVELFNLFFSLLYRLIIEVAGGNSAGSVLEQSSSDPGFLISFLSLFQSQFWSSRASEMAIWGYNMETGL